MSDVTVTREAITGGCSWRVHRPFDLPARKAGWVAVYVTERKAGRITVSSPASGARHFQLKAAVSVEDVIATVTAWLDELPSEHKDRMLLEREATSRWDDLRTQVRALEAA